LWCRSWGSLRHSGGLSPHLGLRSRLATRRECVQSVPEVVRFGNPYWILGWSSGWLSQDSILDWCWLRSWCGLRSWWSCGRRKFTHSRLKHLTNLAIGLDKVSRSESKPNPNTIRTLELLNHHAQLRLAGGHPTENLPKVGVLLLQPGPVLPCLLKLRNQARAHSTISRERARNCRLLKLPQSSTLLLKLFSKRWALLASTQEGRQGLELVQGLLALLELEQVLIILAPKLGQVRHQADALTALILLNTILHYGGRLSNL
jgi:hypothetical protein